MQTKSNHGSAISNIDSLAKLMDSQFTIPGTNIRFGLDAIIGLVPGAGDFATFLISGYMVIVLAKNGASGFVLARMTLNILIDALIGSIPILGDVFDVAFKANQRNVKLMHEHYIEGRHRGGAWKIILPVMLLLLLVIAALAWLSYKIFVWLF
ncbi:MAG: DUF4112 domain-containing protein [Ferruginibacter sp.]